MPTLSLHATAEPGAAVGAAAQAQRADLAHTTGKLSGAAVSKPATWTVKLPSGTGSVHSWPTSHSVTTLGEASLTTEKRVPNDADSPALDAFDSSPPQKL